MPKFIKIILIILGFLVGLVILIATIAIVSAPSSEEIKAKEEKKAKDQIELCDNFMTKFYKEKDLTSLYSYSELLEKANECIKLDTKYSSLQKEFKIWEAGDKKNKVKIAEIDAYYLVHGHKPKHPESDVKFYLKQVANDPSSVSDVECSNPTWGDKLGWEVGCTFRAKNGFGGLIKSQKIFYISKDRVISL